MQQSHLNTQKARFTFKAQRVSTTFCPLPEVPARFLDFLIFCIKKKKKKVRSNFYVGRAKSSDEWTPNSQPRAVSFATSGRQNTECYCSTSLACPRRMSSCCLSSPLLTSFPPLHSFPRRDLACLYRRRPAVSKVQQARSPSWAPGGLCQFNLVLSQYICPVIATSLLCLSKVQQFSHQGWDYGRDPPRFPLSFPHNTCNSKPNLSQDLC